MLLNHGGYSVPGCGPLELRWSGSVVDPVFSVPEGLGQCAQNTEFNTAFLSPLTERETGILRESPA